MTQGAEAGEGDIGVHISIILELWNGVKRWPWSAWAALLMRFGLAITKQRVEHDRDSQGRADQKQHQRNCRLDLALDDTECAA